MRPCRVEVKYLCGPVVSRLNIYAAFLRYTSVSTSDSDWMDTLEISGYMVDVTLRLTGPMRTRWIQLIQSRSI